jgi:ribose 1,5-bisphosphokinase PhnN
VICGSGSRVTASAVARLETSEQTAHRIADVVRIITRDAEFGGVEPPALAQQNALSQKDLDDAQGQYEQSAAGGSA